MSAVPSAIGNSRVARLYQSTVGKKAIMAATGLILFGFVIGHMAGNLQFFLPNAREALRQYAENLRALGPVLWVVRFVLLAAVVLHITSAFQLWQLNREARPQRYRKLTPANSTYASRTMIWSGPILAAFIVYHLLHLTTGTVHPQFNEDFDVYANLITGFSNPAVALFYLIAMGLLCLHLYHGAWSMFQSLGLSHPKYTPGIKKAAAVISILLLIGFSSVPLAVLLGIRT
jgi:succinate dehydrogenase / fumarate reductase, cytochrome b subunit